ncbi:hypothetical protein KQX54_016654 [Cotesia glomerata]|uniref:Uncharacterized protein n=1 Tax=Cotesia glomerata TaxID=32391 RepID=A0AAV7IRE0_COTGL|nr:hypothetical protein KQX54_016654 [Cotesia glomerata]
MKNYFYALPARVEEDEVDSDAETEVDEDLPGPIEDVESEDSGYDSDAVSEINGERLARSWFGFQSRISEANLGSRGGRIPSLYVDEELCLQRFRHAASLPAGRHLLELESVPRMREGGFLFMDPLLVLLGDLSSEEVMWIFGQLPWQGRDFRSRRSLLRELISRGPDLRQSLPNAPPRILGVLEWYIMLLGPSDTG